MLDEVAKLAKEGSFDYLVIESSGISMPMSVAEIFTLPMMHDPQAEECDDETHDHYAGMELREVTKLDTCVTVIDCSSFFTYFRSQDLAAEKFDDCDETDDRSVMQLLLD